MAQTWTIHEVAHTTGTTSRTMRHYHAIGLLHPSEIAANGYRLYNASALLRLQRILVLRDIGMNLAQIGAVLDRDVSEIEALTKLEQQLRQESARLNRQITSVQYTLAALKKGEPPMPKEMFDGFQHEQFKDEVEERWGTDAYQQSDNWWKSMSEDERRSWQTKLQELNQAWQHAVRDAVAANSDIVQALAARHVKWLGAMPTMIPPAGFRSYVKGLGDLYVSDPRFAANYGGEQGATLVRDALTIYAHEHLA